MPARRNLPSARGVDTRKNLIWARLGVHESSITMLRAAMRLGEESGALSNAGLAALALVEEHAARLSQREIFNAYLDADRLLKDVQNPEDAARLRACAGVVMRRLYEVRLEDENFPLRGAVRDLEARLIEQALREAGGSVTRAAKLLGMGHQSLGKILKTRHKNLLDLRTPAPLRRKSIIGRTPRKTKKPPSGKLPSSIFVVEDNSLVAGAVRDTLEGQGWAVAVCAEGAQALQEIEGDAPYTLFLFDYDLPNVNGIELVRRVRELPHRRRAPVVMFTAADCERAAWLAGVDAFLRKPEDVEKVAVTITRLLPVQRGVKK